MKNKEKAKKSPKKFSRNYSIRVATVLFSTILFFIITASLIHLKTKNERGKKEEKINRKELSLLTKKLTDCQSNLEEGKISLENLQGAIEAKEEEYRKNAPKRPKRLVGDGCYKVTNGYPSIHGVVRKDFNRDPSNIILPYIDRELGISFDIPYNKSWGNKDCVVLPYVESKQHRGPLSKPLYVSFGLTTEGRPFEFHNRIKRDKEDLFNEQKGSGEPDPNPRIQKIGQWEIVVYESYGMATSRTYEIFGERNNYIFSFMAFPDDSREILDKNSLKIIEVIKTFKEIDPITVNN